MSSAALVEDLAAWLRQLGLPPAGPQLQAEAATHAERFVSTSPAAPHDALASLAHCWVEKVCGEEVAAELPGDLPSEVLLALAAAAWKKTAPTDRARVQDEVWKVAGSNLAARARLRASLSRVSPQGPPAETVQPTPADNPGKSKEPQEQRDTTATQQTKSPEPHEPTGHAHTQGPTPDEAVSTRTLIQAGSLKEEIRSSVQRALAEAKVATRGRKAKCAGCGFGAAKCICIRPSPARPATTQPPPEDKTTAAQVINASGGNPADTSSESSSETASSAETAAQGQQGFDKNAQRWGRLAGAGWEDEAVILNPAVWQVRLATAPQEEWELFRSMERRWLTPRGGKPVQAESLRRLAVENLKFFVRLSGPTPTPETTRWAIRNLDELETSVFIESGASPGEVEDFRRRLLGEDRPSRYKTAWRTKTQRGPKDNKSRQRTNRDKRDRQTDGRKDKDGKKN